MDVTSLTEVLGSATPSATVVLDVTNADEAGAHEVELRWRDLRRALADAGAAEEDLAALDPVALAPTGVGGPATRYLAARDGRVLLDQLLLEGTRDGVGEVATGPVVDVVPLLRYEHRHAPVVVVHADREGADVEVVTAAGGPATDSASTDGTTLHLNKVGAAFGDPQYQRRSENAWRGNAEQAAEQAGQMAREAGAAAVIVSGDVHARRLVAEALHLPETIAVAQVEGDTRAAGSSHLAVDGVVARGMDERAARTEDEAVGRWRAVHDDPETRARTTDDLRGTVEAVRQGQVEELLLVPAALRERTLLVGPSGPDVAVPGTDPTWDGDVLEAPADLALVRAAAHTGADVQLVELESAALPDGVGARLRWARDAAPGEGPGAV